jgi:hypothetical protein
MVMNMKYRVRIMLTGEIERSINVDFPNFALATQLAEQVASQGYTQQITQQLWDHYLPSDIKAIYIMRLPEKVPLPNPPSPESPDDLPKLEDGEWPEEWKHIGE